MTEEDMAALGFALTCGEGQPPETQAWLYWAYRHVTRAAKRW